MHVLQVVVTLVGGVADHETQGDLVAGADHDAIEVVFVE